MSRLNLRDWYISWKMIINTLALKTIMYYFLWHKFEHVDTVITGVVRA